MIDADEVELDRWYGFICAGVWWMRLQDRQQYRWLVDSVRRAGIDVKQFNSDVADGVKNGFIVTPDREPSPGVRAS